MTAQSSHSGFGLPAGFFGVSFVSFVFFVGQLHRSGLEPVSRFLWPARPNRATLDQLMTNLSPTDGTNEAPGFPKSEALIAESDNAAPLTPIAELAIRPDFPQCAIGHLLDMGGFTGVGLEIVNQSLKVKSPEGFTRSFNIPGLRRRYTPPPPLPPPLQSLESDGDPFPKAPVPARPQKATAPDAPAPQRLVASSPNFDQPVKAIRVFAGRRDFPECTLGELVDIRGFSGVVVEIVKDSLQIKAEDGSLRTYEAELLRKLFGRP